MICVTTINNGAVADTHKQHCTLYSTSFSFEAMTSRTGIGSFDKPFDNPLNISRADSRYVVLHTCGAYKTSVHNVYGLSYSDSPILVLPPFNAEIACLIASSICLDISMNYSLNEALRQLSTKTKVKRSPRFVPNIHA